MRLIPWPRRTPAPVLTWRRSKVDPRFLIANSAHANSQWLIGPAGSCWTVELLHNHDDRQDVDLGTQFGQVSAQEAAEKYERKHRTTREMAS